MYIPLTLFLSYVTDMKEEQKEYQGGSCALDQTTSQESAMNPQPVLDSTVPVPVSRGMVEVEMSIHSLFVHLEKALPFMSLFLVLPILATPSIFLSYLISVACCFFMCLCIVVHISLLWSIV